MHLKKPQFTYNAVDHLLKIKKESKSFKKLGDSTYIYRNELNKACFQHDMAYGDLKT